MPVSLSHADQCAEGTSSHAPPQCKKVPIYCPGTDGWAWLQSWRSPVSEPPMLHVERTVPRTSENPRPNARPIPGPRRLTRVNLNTTQRCCSAYSSEPTCHRPQIRSIDDPLTVPRDQTVPDDAQNPPPDAQPMPTPQHLPRVDKNSTQHFNSAGSSVPALFSCQLRRLSEARTDDAPWPDRPRRSRGAPAEPTAATDPPPA